MTNPSATAELAALADRFWDGYLETYPIFATIIGDRRFDDRLPDRSPAAIARQRAWFEEIARSARAVDPAELDPAGRVTRQMLADEAAGLAASIETRVDEWTVDPLGPTVSLLDLVDWHTLERPDAGRALVARWRGVGEYLDQVIAGLRRAAADGLVACATPVERLLDVLGELEHLPPEEWRTASPATAPLEGWPEAERERFRADVVAATREVVIPAFLRCRDVLAREILPLARPADRPGLVHVPGGEAAYRTLIRIHTTLDLAPEAIHRTGLEEIARIDGEFVELGRRLLGTEDLGATLARLRDDPALRFATSDEVFQTAKDSLARANAAMTDWFGRVPGAACVVVPIPSHSEAHQTIAYYYWPAMDGSRPGRYYINLHAPETRPRYEAEALAFHESVPGHHLQIAIAQELDGLPAFQRNLGSTAFAEGWGLYTERLSDEMGLYSGDMDRFGILSFDAWRAGRLVVDTGMHALGWTRQQAIDFLAQHTALGLNNIANEVDRYIVWPGQALAYKIGQLEILRQRAEAERRLGARFEIKAFHDTVLGSGAVSLPALGEIVERWLSEAATRRDG
ncbi:MAG TPA: DUF885 domain-containing protein [Candidatus Deferrimicrobiaceae bacterium]|nr:DUF885 domain-containing protein [Candidatus Deferrimicrobiaceae bacterium]